MISRRPRQIECHGAAVFLIVAAGFEYPPAARVNPGLVPDEYESHALGIVFAGILCLAVAHPAPALVYRPEITLQPRF
jgi:hypothetical protein